MARKVYFQQIVALGSKGADGGPGQVGELRGRSWNFVLSRSMRISVPFPYARISTASLSICSSVKPDLRLMIFRSCVVRVSQQGRLEWLHRAWRGVARKWRDKQYW